MGEGAWGEGEDGKMGGEDKRGEGRRERRTKGGRDRMKAMACSTALRQCSAVGRAMHSHEYKRSSQTLKVLMLDVRHRFAARSRAKT